MGTFFEVEESVYRIFQRWCEQTQDNERNVQRTNRAKILIILIILLIISLFLERSPFIQQVMHGNATPVSSVVRATPASNKPGVTPVSNGVAITPASNGIGTTPFMGWSTWDFIGSRPTEANVEAQAQVEASKLKAYGYNYVLLDDYWYMNPATTVDQYGRWSIDTQKFPDGLAGVASYVHGLGLKFGAYLTPGIPVAAVNQNTPIEGTSYHAQDIADTSKIEYNYNFGGATGNTNKVMYAINFSAPGAQAYINAWADQLASWGVDFLKLDGVGDWDIPEVQAWSQALQQTGRPILFNISNTLDVRNASLWRHYANAWRIDTDIECYCATRVTWASIANRFSDVAQWVKYAGIGGWNDLDALQITNGGVDGISNDERQTYMTLWAIEAAPLYAGDDLTTMDSYGLSLLTNPEVIAVDQRGIAARPVSQSSSQQVWYTNNTDGSYTVALFNLGNTPATVTANWSDLGFSGAATVRDLWSQSDLGSFTNSFSATLNTHASRLLKVTLAPVTYYKLVNRNSGQVIDVANNATNNGGQIIQWPFQNTSNQEWQVELVDNGGYKLLNRNSGQVLDNPNDATSNGTAQDQWVDTNSPNQWWNLVAVGNGYYYLINEQSGLYLDVMWASAMQGISVIEWPYNGGSNQQWQVVPVT
jgi:alpha-galactosidase